LKLIGHIVYAVLLISILIDAVKTAMPHFFGSGPITPGLILLTTSVGFCSTYFLHIFKQSSTAIYFCIICYLLFAAWQIGRVYFWPIMYAQEYIAGLIIWFIIGTPIFLAFYRQVRSFRGSLSAKRT
jgi:hypothetical protein